LPFWWFLGIIYSFEIKGFVVDVIFFLLAVGIGIAVVSHGFVWLMER